VTRSALAVSLERIESLENANFLLIQKANRDKEIREGAARCEVEREMLGERLFNSGGVQWQWLWQWRWLHGSGRFGPGVAVRSF
jgi:hypothetical protein